MKWPLSVYPESVNRYHNEVYDVYSIIFSFLGMGKGGGWECISNDLLCLVHLLIGKWNSSLKRHGSRLGVFKLSQVLRIGECFPAVNKALLKKFLRNSVLCSWKRRRKWGLAVTKHIYVQRMLQSYDCIISYDSSSMRCASPERPRKAPEEGEEVKPPCIYTDWAKIVHGKMHRICIASAGLI